MRELLNTLYVQTQGSYLRLEGETVIVEVERTERTKLPLHHLGALVLFGNVMMSPFLLGRCAEDGRSVVWMTAHGRFQARMEGPRSGNVLLRHAQHRATAQAEVALELARGSVAGKLQNSRLYLLRAARDAQAEPPQVCGLPPSAWSGTCTPPVLPPTSIRCAVRKAPPRPSISARSRICCGLPIPPLSGPVAAGAHRSIR